MRRFSIATLLVLSTLACSHLSADRVGKTAEEDFQIGMSYFKDESWPEASKAFENVRLKYPYSKFAALAELRSADTKFQEEKYIEAAEAYRQFVKMHPNHEEVDYAALRIGLSHWKSAPSRFFALPPDYEKDLADVRSAVMAFQDFLRNYPNSKHRPLGQKYLTEATDKLLEHEWYVVEFYRKRDRWPAVAARLEGILRDYPGSKSEPQAYLLLANAYVEMKDRSQAQQALQRLVAKYPQDPSRAEAEKLLSKLR